MTLSEATNGGNNPFLMSRKIFYSILTIFSLYIGSTFGFKDFSLSDLLTYEQTVFIMTTGIMIVFRDFIFSHSSITSIRNNISKLSEKKDNYIQYTNGAQIEFFDEYINTLNKDIEDFKDSANNIKKSSSYFFLVFIIVGILATILLFLKISFYPKPNFIFMNFFSSLLYYQLVCIIVWALGGIIEDLRRVKINNFFDKTNVYAEFSHYCNRKNEKNLQDINFGKI